MTPLLLAFLALPGCDADGTDDASPTVTPLPAPLRALTPTEYNNTIRDLLVMPDDGDDWPAAPAIAARFTAYEGEQSGVFGISTAEEPPWPRILPEEAGVAGFEGLAVGQEPSAYLLEELQKAAVHFASFALVSSDFFQCEDWSTTQDLGCAWTSIARFAQRAWRRPLDHAERERLEAFWDANLADGTPEEALVLTVAGILQAPQFVYRIERGDPDRATGDKVPLTDWEVATRLSLLLWDSMPDPLLFQAAADGELSTADGVRTQVQRMLQDDRAHAALVRFHDQWLGTNAVHTVSPDRSAYGPLYGLDPDPELDTTGDEEWPSVLGPVRYSMEAEVFLFIRDVLSGEDPTLTSLLTHDQGWYSNYTRPLYGAVETLEGGVERWPYETIVASLPTEGTLNLTPIAFPEGERAGLLTLPAFLAVGAYTIHPAPVLRGHTIIERMTCVDLGVPPPGAEAETPEDTLDVESTNRARTEEATSPAECAGCHDILNPPGFAFEHYDAMGMYRAEDNGQPVDATGSYTVAGETFSFTDALELSTQLASSEQVRDCYSLHWARSATGDSLDRDDERLAAFQHPFRSDDDVLQLLEDIAASDLFRHLWHEEDAR